MTARTYSTGEIRAARGKPTHLEATDIDDVTWLARVATLLDGPLTDGNAIVSRRQATVLQYRGMGWEPEDVSDLAGFAAGVKTQERAVTTGERKTR